MPVLTVSQIAIICKGEVRGNGELSITGANNVEDAGPSEVSFVASEKAITIAADSRAGCLIVPIHFRDLGERSLVAVDHPRSAFTKVLHALYPAPKTLASRHPTAVIAATATIGHNVSIGAYVVIGEGAVIGADCRLNDHVSVGDSVIVGPGTHIYPHAVLYAGVRVGARCVLHSGCAIGADGFGFTFGDGRYQKFPQVGTVQLGDDVEIGANSCIDRAALGVTSIGDGTKLDNLIHVAHNCKVGAHVVIAAQTGFSGGVTVGDYAIIGGQVGVGDRASIASKAVVGSQAGILPKKHVPAGEAVWGTPARPLRQYLKGLAHIAKLSKYQDERHSKRKSSSHPAEPPENELQTCDG